jgi:hypothetical protein
MTKILKVERKPFIGCFDDFGPEHQAALKAASLRAGRAATDQITSQDGSSEQHSRLASKQRDNSRYANSPVMTGQNPAHPKTAIIQ